MGDAELVRALLSRDPCAWTEFHRRFDRLIYRCIHDVLRPFGARFGMDDAREIRASLLLALHDRDQHRLRVFDVRKGRTLGSWIGKLATHCAIDYARKHGRRTPLDFDEESIELSERSSDPERDLCARERLECVREAVMRLSARDRELLALDIEHGLAPVEIALRMGVSVKTVYSKSHKIREKLRAALHTRDLDVRALARAA
jgi:RNA polymerase sigma-70 factor (ECF subfamily)